NWFANEGQEAAYHYTWKRPNWFQNSAAEHTAIRTGVARDGHRLHPGMPYAVAYDQMRDDDVRAIVAYLRSLEPVKRAIPRQTDLDHTQLSCCFPVTVP
ncbi:MAG: c-type cytochrome, partial [Myxococcota bacterium]